MNDKIDRRLDARIVHSAHDEVKAIQTLLADVYKDAGDGRTLVRELVQNADDARASKLIFVILEDGWSGAQNGLLHGPALLVLNDGPFAGTDRDALHRALGGSKAEDAEKIGRFGIGLKSVFHICEAIVYLGCEEGTLRPGVLNPWAGTGEQGNADPLHPDWDTIENDDLGRLLGLATQLFGTFDDGLLLWIPLRSEHHRDRADEGRYGLGQFCPDPHAVRKWFDRSASLTLLLAQCGYLLSIEANSATAADSLASRTQIALVTRPGVQSGAWLGRYRDDDPVPDRTFQ